MRPHARPSRQRPLGARPGFRVGAAALVCGLALATACSSDPAVVARPDATDGPADTAEPTDPTDPTTVDTTGTTEPVDTTAGTTVDTTGTPEGLEPGWLILAWEAGDNDLEAALLSDIQEMGTVVAEDVDIVTMFDRSDDDDPYGGYTDEDTYVGIPEELGASQVLAGGNGEMSLVASIEEVNTGDPDALASFIAQAMTEYPREHVAIVISDHGAGWKGVAVDEDTGDRLELGEITAAFDAALEATGRQQFDVIGFDACLMATLEVGAAVASQGRYLVASEEVEPGAGWDWTVLDQIDATTDAETVGEIFVEGYRAYYEDESIIANQTMSLVDLSQIDELSAAVSALVEQAGTDPTAAAVGLARAAVRAYGFADAPDPAQSYHLLDIGDLAETLSVQNPAVADAAQGVLAALDAAVITSITGSLSDQATGLSIYLPPNAELADERYLGLDGMRDWQGQLASYLGVTASVSVPAAFSDPDKYIEGTWTSGGFQIESDYDPAADATVVDARLRYGTYNEDYTSMIFFGSDQLTFGDGHVGGVWDPQIMRITDGTSSAFAYSTFEVSGDRSRAIVSIPMEYVWPDGGSDRVDLRFVFDQSGTMLSKDFVVYTSSGVGRAELDPNGELYPIAAWQSIETFEEVWERTSSVPFAADISGYDGGYVPMEETLPIVAQLELHALDGSVDFVFAGDAVPFAFYEERTTYPSPA